VRGVDRALPLPVLILRTRQFATGVPAGVAAVLKAMRAWSFREDFTCQGCLALMVGAPTVAETSFLHTGAACCSLGFLCKVLTQRSCLQALLRGDDTSRLVRVLNGWA